MGSSCAKGGNENDLAFSRRTRRKDKSKTGIIENTQDTVVEEQKE